MLNGKLIPYRKCELVNLVKSPHILDANDIYHIALHH